MLEQRVGRIYRLGQDQPVDVYHLVAATGIEARIAHIVGDKRALFSGLFDGTSDEVPFDGAGSFLTRMHEILAPEVDVIDEDAEGSAVTAAGDDAGLHATDATDATDAGMPAVERDRAPHGPVDVDGDSHEASRATTADGASAPVPSVPSVAGLDTASLSALLGALAVRPLADGRISLELPRAAAPALGSLLRALASAVDGLGIAEPR